MNRHATRLSHAVIACAALLMTGAHARALGVGDVPAGSQAKGFASLAGVFTQSPTGDELSTTHVSPQVSGGIRIASRFALTLDAAGALTSYRIQGEPRTSTMRKANPIFAVHYFPLEKPALTLRLGLGAGAPLVTVPGTIPANVAALYGDTVAVEARGFDGYALWARNAVPLLSFLSAKVVRGSFASEASVQPALLVSVNGAPLRTAMLSSLSAGYVQQWFSTGVRAQLYVASEPLARNDFSQFALVPYARVDQNRVFYRLECVVNIDGPYGLGGARGATVWGAAAATGVTF